MDYKIKTDKKIDYPMGVSEIDGGFHVNVVSASTCCSLVLYERNVEKPLVKIELPPESRIGDVWSADIFMDIDKQLEYAFEDERGQFEDPYAKTFSGRDTYGKMDQYKNPRRSPLMLKEYDWESDTPPRRSFDETIIYELHVRGFTKSASSKVVQKGTWEGVIEKIPYMQELGITAVELMPCMEYDEIMMPQGVVGNPYGKEEPIGKVNYWGYVKSLAFAPKAGYSRRKDRRPADEYRDMIKALHLAGIEVIVQMYFDGSQSVSYVLDALRNQVAFYHVDGIHIVGYAPTALIASDPYLADTKLIAESWDGVIRGRVKHLAQYHDGFKTDMRRFLKGDEGMLSSLIFNTRTNPQNAAPINFLAGANGFTMMDMVSYDIKHNEANGEDNKDGTDSNYSWNCGVEGPTKKKKISELRFKQLKNAYLLLFLSQGTPLIMAGDEFGRTQNGNNNSYCQDNELTWINWKLLNTNKKLYEWVKMIIEFRKDHPVFRYPEEPKILDTAGCGIPDVSYHGVNAWQPEFENWRRQLGIMYCGEYAKKSDGTDDDTFYVMYNMHWEPHEFALPNPQRDYEWQVCMDTSMETVKPVIKDQKKYMVADRSIVVLVSKKKNKPKKYTKTIM